MAGSGFKRFTTLEKLTSADVNNYLMDQSVMVFDDISDRSTTIGTAVAEGMVSYLKDTNQVEVYDSSSWVAISGDITGVTAGTGLSGGGTAGDVTLSADYAAIGSALALTTGTAGYTALSNGTAGITYQPVSHNYIINGAFDVWQRGTSLASSAGGRRLADRLRNDSTGSTYTVSQESFSPAEVNATGFGDANFYHRTVVTSVAGTNNYALVDLAVEDVRTLAGQTITFSFWAKADAAKDVSIEFQQGFGSGGSAGVNTNGGKISLTTSWARHSATFAIPSISGKTLGAGSLLNVRLWLEAGSGFDARTNTLGQQSITFDTWGWQLEAGSVATPFKRHAPSLQGELAACQRYYQRHDGMITDVFVRGATTTYGTFRFPEMRVAPTPTASSATGFSMVISDDATKTSTAFTPAITGTTSSRFAFSATGMTAGEGGYVSTNSGQYIEMLGAEL